jgi:hypothetical protein
VHTGGQWRNIQGNALATHDPHALQRLVFAVEDRQQKRAQLDTGARLQLEDEPVRGLVQNGEPKLSALRGPTKALLALGLNGIPALT